MLNALQLLYTQGERKVKIALFTDSFLPGIGGTVNVVLKLATELSKEHSVMVLVPSYHRPYEENLDLPFKVVRAKSLGASKNEYWAMPGITRKVKRALDEFKPDILHSHTIGMMAGYANKYAKKHGIPVICTVHTKFKYCYDEALKLPVLVKILLKFVMRRPNRADRVTSVSYSMIEELKRYGLKKPLTIIRNGNYPKEHIPTEKTPNDKFTLLYVGMIIKYKNLDFSLRALKELKKTHPDFVFYMIGRGAHEKKFKKYVKKLGLENNVVMTGAITDKQKLNEYYKKADLFLFTSVFDNDGLVLIEAAENDTPALVLEGTGSAERFVDGKTGFFAKPNERAVAEKIAYLMENPKELKDVGGRAYAICISWDDIVNEYVELYKEEIDKKAHGVDNKSKLKEFKPTENGVKEKTA